MFAKLSDAAWTRRADLRTLTQALGAQNIRWVGGAVRDSLLGLEVDDVDCATRLPPDEVMQRCSDAGIATVPTGIEHGSLTALLKDGPVEVTTLRRDVATDGRRATVAFTEEWREDAARRDFTINALYAHPETLAIVDYFGGSEDLAARRVRFIGDARERIGEDHLRILRYFRFQARFRAKQDDQAEAACSQLAYTLRDLSHERVAAELMALLSLPDPHPTVARMHQLGILQQILPETLQPQIELLGKVIAAECAQNIAPHPLRRIAALLPPLVEVADTVAVRLRLSRAQRAHLVAVADRKPTDQADPRALAYRKDKAIATDRLLLQGDEVSSLIDWIPPQFPLRGGEIVARGITPGPQVAATLRAVEDAWVAEGFPSRERVLDLLESELSA